MKKHLTLVGFLGAYNSKVGHAAAYELGVHAYDTDRWVTDTTGLALWQITSDPGGETRLRELELEALESFLSRQPGVISTGSGIVMSPEARSVLANYGGQVVYLSMDFTTVSMRALEETVNVGLIMDDEAAFCQRDPLYHEVARCIVGASQPLEAVVADVLQNVI